MKNKLNPNELDELLRKSFLSEDGNDPELQKLNEMLAQQIFESDVEYIPNAEKEKQLLKSLQTKKASFKIKWILSGLAFVAAVCALIYFYMHSENKSKNSVSSLVKNESPKYTEPKNNLVPVSVDEKERQQKTMSYKAMPTDCIHIKEEIKVSDIIQNPPSFEFIPAVVVNAPAEIEKEEKGVPVLTEEDKKQNHKRIAILVKSVNKAKSSEWAKINILPNGTACPEYYMECAEVTNIQYKTFLLDLVENNRIEEFQKARPKTELWAKLGISSFDKIYFYESRFDNHPAVNIEPQNMEMYAQWLSEKVNEKKQGNVTYELYLPSVEEWKNAARAPQSPSSVYGTGHNKMTNEKNCMLGNYKPITAKGEFINIKGYVCNDSTEMVSGKFKFCSNGENDSTLYYTVPVYAFNPNYRGIYCMSGNAAEIVKKADGTYRSIGGNWNSTQYYLAVDAPDEFKGKSLQSPFVGFRLCFKKKIRVKMD